MVSYKILASSADNTVVSEYESKIEQTAYQSESDLENKLIKDLGRQGYEYLNIRSEKELIENLRRQLELLNQIKFSDNEWKEFFNNVIANRGYSVEDKTELIQVNYQQTLTRDDGTSKNILLIDKDNPLNNSVQVMNQYEVEGARNNRYDTTILVNGFPMVHIELKRRGVALKEAFNQIKRYERESFWAGSGLFEYIQIFVISNGTYTKYYSNTTRYAHVKENLKPQKKSSGTYQFTMYWTTTRNKKILDLVDFTATFLTKSTLLNIITKYCVFTVDKQLMVMRPYQIAAAENIINRIKIAHNYKYYGTKKAGGYIWHSTGSGKTLTSFKTSQIATKLGFIDKVMFVVDRKDLDYQTIKEYDKFAKGAANSSASTEVLKRQIEDTSSKIIVTTIQKLSNFIKKYPNHDIYGKEVVLIFDECHRSQFGSMHSAIVKHFKKYYIFGFTGTPIFASNATAKLVVKNDRNSESLVDLTTEQLFGDRLHTYTIINAINDENVLPFKIDYINTIKAKNGIVDIKVNSIDEASAFLDQKRISAITTYILEHFDQKTKGQAHYKFEQEEKKGFNSILATESIEMAKKYYLEFKKQNPDNKIRVATIFSYQANEVDMEDVISYNDESFDLEGLDLNSRDFLELAIKDYNEMFKTNFDTSNEKFYNYYKDVSLKMKNKEIDLLIVVNMFLTGFDSKTLNTLWIDKNLNMHGLIQAFSRTNRILNSVKTFGNVVCFRNLQSQTDEALALFGDEDAKGIVLLRTFNDYYYGYDLQDEHFDGYTTLIERLYKEFPLGKELFTDKQKKLFVNLFGVILKLRNILVAFDEFEEKDLLSEYELQNYTSVYLEMFEHFRNRNHNEKTNINDDLVFEIELVKQSDINIDYILMLVEDWCFKNRTDKQLLVKIKTAIESSVRLRSKKELIQKFIESVNVDESNLFGKSVKDTWSEFTEKEKEEELNEIIKSLNLKPNETKDFLTKCLQEGFLKVVGTEIDNILPPVSRFSNNGEDRLTKKEQTIEALQVYFEKYYGV